LARLEAIGDELQLYIIEQMMKAEDPSIQVK
jgi:hypothetical protein